MNLNFYSTMDYEKKSDWTIGQNKPNSNPIKPCPERSRMGQSPKSPNECKLNFNKGLQKKRHFLNPNKQSQFPKRPKMNVNLYIIEDYENETTLRPKKTNPNKPNSCGFLLEFIPHRVYPALRCGDAGMRGYGDAGQE